MNVFEFLGLPATHRAESKVVQLVKHYDDVNKRADEGILHKKVSFPMYGQVKRDGVFALLVIRHGIAAIFNRTGKRMTNCQRLEEYFENSGLMDGAYLGELLSRNCSLEELSGVVNPNRVKPLDTPEKISIRNNLHIDFFDLVTLDAFEEGHTYSTFRERHNKLVQRVGSNATVLNVVFIKDQAALDAFATLCIGQGEEGAVFKQDVEWLAGAKDWHQMKKVRGIHVDLECIGWEEGTGKYEGHVANLLFHYKNGKTVKAMLGKGWTHKDAKDMFYSIKFEEQYGDDFKGHSPIGKIFHVYGLQESSKGVIRLPKVSELRHDKTEPDF